MWRRVTVVLGWRCCGSVREGSLWVLTVVGQMLVSLAVHAGFCSMRDAGTCGLVVLRYTDSLTSVIRLKLFLAAVFCGNKICKKVLMCIFWEKHKAFRKLLLTVSYQIILFIYFC